MVNATGLRGSRRLWTEAGAGQDVGSERLRAGQPDAQRILTLRRSAGAPDPPTQPTSIWFHLVGRQMHEHHREIQQSKCDGGRVDARGCSGAAEHRRGTHEQLIE